MPCEEGVTRYHRRHNIPVGVTILTFVIISQGTETMLSHHCVQSASRSGGPGELGSVTFGGHSKFAMELFHFLLDLRFSNSFPQLVQAAHLEQLEMVPEN